MLLRYYRAAECRGVNSVAGIREIDPAACTRWRRCRTTGQTAPRRSIVRNPMNSQRTRRLWGKKRKRKNIIRVNTDHRDRIVLKRHERVKPRSCTRGIGIRILSIVHANAATSVYVTPYVRLDGGGYSTNRISRRNVSNASKEIESHVQIIIHHLFIGDVRAAAQYRAVWHAVYIYIYIV